MITPSIAECVLLEFQTGNTPVGEEFEKDGFALLPAR